MRVLTFGTFDDFHPGHEAYLKQGQARGELFVVVGRDANVLRFKGKAPLQDEQTRMRNVQQAFPNATVLLGHETDYMARIREIQPDLILLGYDQKLPPGMDEKALGCRIERAEAFMPEVHKSSIRRMAED